MLNQPRKLAAVISCVFVKWKRLEVAYPEAVVTMPHVEIQFSGDLKLISDNSEIIVLLVRIGQQWEGTLIIWRLLKHEAPGSKQTKHITSSK